MFSEQDIFWMRQAITLAQQAAQLNEIPVGAVLVRENHLIGAGHNAPIAKHDPTAHAEIVVIRQAAKKIGNYRLLGMTLYVTLEPCLMCVGAMVHARIERLVYGATDAKTGAVVSRLQALDQDFLNHRVVHRGGLLAHECGQLLSEFFQIRRGLDKGCG
ncbi:MAG TPA: tRNA adenosine(34) deaminase TadA [Gammaproteobacteria bacterium]|jgi:tRNA(adenine34) deaminase|nr:tRNA adenosine(34) deaminase TadA [Gammaproteobacteria bacterium]